VPKRKTTRRGTSQKRTAKSSAPTTRKAAARKTSKSKTAKSKPAKRAAKPKAVERVSPEDEAAYTEALIQSGQAAPLDSEGKLPAGATHKIVEDPAGQIKVVRRRFSIS
jgi:hypothetical protein